MTTKKWWPSLLPFQYTFCFKAVKTAVSPLTEYGIVSQRPVVFEILNFEKTRNNAIWKEDFCLVHVFFLKRQAFVKNCWKMLIYSDIFFFGIFYAHFVTSILELVAFLTKKKTAEPLTKIVSSKDVLFFV